jgi:hypothetical protein
MNYQAFTSDSLTMMYEAIRGALAADDALKRRGRGMRFEVIDWSEDQPTGWPGRLPNRVMHSPHNAEGHFLSLESRW